MKGILIYLLFFKCTISRGAFIDYKSSKIKHWYCCYEELLSPCSYSESTVHGEVSLRFLAHRNCGGVKEEGKLHTTKLYYHKSTEDLYIASSRSRCQTRGITLLSHEIWWCFFPSRTLGMAWPAHDTSGPRATGLTPLL